MATNPKLEDTASIEYHLERALIHTDYILSNGPSKMYKSRINRYKAIRTTLTKLIGRVDEIIEKYEFPNKSAVERGRLKYESLPSYPGDLTSGEVEDEDSSILHITGTPRLIMQQIYSSVFTLQDRKLACTDIDDIDLIWNTLLKWIITRYAKVRPERYKVAKLFPSFDTMLISAGWAIRSKEVDVWVKAVEDWLPTLTKSNLYLLPEAIVYGYGRERYSHEALYLERILKPLIFSESFCPEFLHSIEDEMISHDEVVLPQEALKDYMSCTYLV